MEKSVTIKVDDKVIEQNTFKRTVGEVLEANHIRINPHDRVTPELDTKLKENTVITVIRAFPVTIIADGESREIISVPVKVENVLQMAKVSLGEKDLISANLDDLTYKGQVIKVTRVTEETVDLTTAVPFSREFINDNNLEVGLTRTVSRGSPGKIRQMVKITYHDGKE
ncbi:MAG: ubiquitin-like domain-containing protein, partial [Bacillota bacterium]